jgi:hypothetical protein
MKPRPIAKLRGSLDRQLRAYAMAASAAAMGFLVWSQPAAAKIVYTKADQELPVDAILPLDLNHDGIADFSFYFGAGNYGSFAISIMAEQTNQVAGYCQHLSGSCWASALRPDVRVGPNQRFGPYNCMVFGGCGTSSCLRHDKGWKITVLHSFRGRRDGANPEAGLLFSPEGSLYGTTSSTSDSQYGGTVFQIAR